MATGDLQNSIRRLQAELKSCKYAGDTDVRGLVSGDPSSLMPLLHFALLTYSYPLAHHVSSRGYSLHGKSDARFVDALYKLLRDEFNFIPRLTKAQLLSAVGFAEHKSLLVCQVLKLCREHHVLLTKKGGTSMALASKAKTMASLARTSGCASAENRTERESKVNNGRTVTGGSTLSRAPLQCVANRPTKQVTWNHGNAEKSAAKVVVEENFGSYGDADSSAESLNSQADRLSPATASSPGTLASARALLSLYPEDVSIFGKGARVGDGSADVGPSPDWSSARSLPTVSATTKGVPTSAIASGTAEGSAADSVLEADHRHPPPAVSSGPFYPSLARPMPNSSQRYASAAPPDPEPFSRAPASFPSVDHLRQPAAGQPVSLAALDAAMLEDAPKPASSVPKPYVSAVRSRFSPPKTQPFHARSDPVSSATGPISYPPLNPPLLSRSQSHPLPYPRMPTAGPAVSSGWQPGTWRQALPGSAGSQQTRPSSMAHGSTIAPPTTAHSQYLANSAEEGAEADLAAAAAATSTAHPPRHETVQHRPVPSRRLDQHFMMPAGGASATQQLGPRPRPPAALVQQTVAQDLASSSLSSMSSTASEALSIYSTGVQPASTAHTQAPEIGRMMMQMNAMGAQLGFVSTQLSQLLLADRSGQPAAILPAPEPTSMKQSTVGHGAIVPAARTEVGHALETIEARLVLMETRMQRMECSGPTAGQAPQSSAGTVVADHSIEWRATSTSSAQSAVFTGPVQPSASGRAGTGDSAAPQTTATVATSTMPPPRPQDISFSHSTVARSVTVQQSPASLTPHLQTARPINHSTTVSTVDISYVFSNPSTQAFVSGLKNRVKETRRVLTQLSSDGTDTGLSSSLQQQLLLASASTSTLASASYQ